MIAAFDDALLDCASCVDPATGDVVWNAASRSAIHAALDDLLPPAPQPTCTPCSATAAFNAVDAADAVRPAGLAVYRRLQLAHDVRHVTRNDFLPLFVERGSLHPDACLGAAAGEIAGEDAGEAGADEGATERGVHRDGRASAPTVLHEVASLVGQGLVSLPTIETLLLRSPTPDARDGEGRTCLHILCGAITGAAEWVRQSPVGDEGEGEEGGELDAGVEGGGSGGSSGDSETKDGPGGDDLGGVGGVSGVGGGRIGRLRRHLRLIEQVFERLVCVPPPLLLLCSNRQRALCLSLRRRGPYVYRPDS